jgi:hypothetical protein
MEKEKPLVSFSGGETSAFMAQWPWNNRRDEFDMIFVFANTGQENPQTIDFVRRCSEYFGFHVECIEAVVQAVSGKGTRFQVVHHESLSSDGEPFEAVIQKYGIPNAANPHCTRELKERPIRKYAKSLGWESWKTAIGIRVDEIDRMNSKWREHGFVYPLMDSSMCPMTKQQVNLYWSKMPFRLELKGYQGNCKTCWKKSLPKLHQIARENPEWFDFMKRMERKYERFTPDKRTGKESTGPFRFFRNSLSVKDVIRGRNTSKPVANDSAMTDYQSMMEFDESCEVFSGCGSAGN